MEPAGSDRGTGRVVLDGVVKRFAQTTAVDGVSADIPPGTFFALLGPSGCGKSTLLRMVAGLEDPTEGRIHIDGVDVTELSARQRPTAMVFQSYALFPTMSVQENVEYGLRVRRLPASERRKRAGAALERVGMSDFGDRNVTALSGGQQQRVALARALVVEPQVMLFDEPLSNLDVALRERTRGELRALQQQLGTTSLYVTHDQQEAMAVADLMAVMREGRFVQTGSPEVLFEEPETAYVARFLGGSNIVPDSAQARAMGGEPPSTGYVLSVRPEDFDTGAAGLPIRVRTRQYLGAFSEWEVESDIGLLRLRLPSAVVLRDDTKLSARKARWVLNDL
ncbi:MAG: ABC transporter ATP-binding protein [Rhodothermales bacterium]|nr:ABC transporter ATP-binding protein [Rhodothermales bacterium]MBO6779840.1 ABC transporter ATP-binding protein [Rhodothermales bacterium]